MTVRLQDIGFFGRGTIKPVLRTTARVDIHRFFVAVFQDVGRSRYVGFVGQVHIFLFAVCTIRRQIENRARFVLLENLLYGVVSGNVAVHDVLKRHVQEFQAPGFGGIVGEGKNIAANSKDVFKQISPNETARSKNEDRAFELQNFFVVNQNGIGC